MKTKILVCTQMFPLNRDGAIISGMIKNPYYQTLAVSEHVDRVDVITTGESVFSGQIGDIRIFSVGNGWLKGVVKSFIYETRIFLKGLKLLRAEKYDLIHIHHLNVPLLILCKKLGLIQAKIMYTAHGTSTPELNAARQGSRLNHFLLTLNGYVQHFLDSFCWRNADYLLSPSKFQIVEMKKLYKVDRTPIEVVYNGFDEAVYQPPQSLQRRDYIEELGISENDDVVLFVGRAAKKKGIDLLIAAMDKVRNDRPNVRLILVVGYMGRQTDYRDKVKAMAEARDYIQYHESVPESQMSRFYGVADLCVFPSIGYESIPTVIYEAMACGCPILTQYAWGIPEVLEAFFISEDKILKSEFDRDIVDLLVDKQRRERSAADNYAKSRGFSWSYGGAFLADIYRKVLKNA